MSGRKEKAGIATTRDSPYREPAPAGAVHFVSCGTLKVRTMNILGINAYHGNASAAIVCEGKLIAAVEEERFNRVKYAAGFPAAAIRYCLQAAGITLSQVDHVAVPRNPYARLGTKLFYALRMPSFARERARVLAKFTGIHQALAA